MEIWASPEPTFARIDATTVRDQSAETGLDVRLDDAERIAVLGVSASRVPVLWERVAPADPHEHDFSEPARRLEALRAAGVEPIVTLLHHGSGPQYTDLLDPAFPLWFAEYAEAAARMFPWVRRWTPINEPLTTARFATLYGVWFPNMRDDRGFGRAMVNQTLAQQAAMRRIRKVIPTAEFVLTEDLQRYTAGDAGVAEYVAFLRERVYLSLELVAGRVGNEHPLAAFLSGPCGVNALELAMMQRDAAVPDLVAFNHYPHSERYLFTQGGATADVPAVYVAGEPAPAIGPLLQAAAERLRLPLAVGEVHVHAPAPERVRWLAQHAAEVQQLRAGGVDVRAVGAWAAFGMVDWHSLLRVRARVAEDGIYTFAGPNGTPQPTAVAEAVRELAASGRIDDRGVRGWWERPDRALPLQELIAMRDAGIPEGDHLRTTDEALALNPPELFVAGLHLRWDGVWQRPHHLLTRLAQRLPVIVLEEPYGAAVDRDEVRRHEGLTVVRPLRRRGWSVPLVDDAALATVRALAGSRRCGAWLYTPMMTELIDAFAASPVVYDAMDDLANFDFAPAGMHEREEALLARAGVVFAGGRTLYENRRGYGAKVRLRPSGVELERFAADVGPHPLAAMLSAPVLAYVGVIDERLDYELIAALADAFPHGHVILAGPVVKVDPARLPQRANVHYTGRLPYNALPSLLAGVDVALMPFAINRATASISPTKTLEYFAARRPVVSTPIADVVAAYGDIAYIAAEADAFVAAVHRALEAPAERIERGFAAAAAQTWEAIFAGMWDEVLREG